jgi:hypothetical protein
MSTLGDAAPAPDAPAYATAPAPRDEDRDRDSLFQEINERRARVENSELLQHLRSL